MKQPVDLKLPLEYPVQPNPPPRPKRDDEAVIARTVDSILDDVMAHLEADEDAREEVRDDLIACFEDAPNDGYDAASWLESHHHWEADMDLCEILDSVARFGKLTEMIREWVEANQIRPQFAVGDGVLVPVTVKRLGKDGISYIARCELLPGIVTSIYADRAQYVVKTAENKREGSGYLIDYENAQLDPNADPAERPAGERPGSPDPAPAAGILPDRTESEIDVLPEQSDRGGSAARRAFVWAGQSAGVGGFIAFVFCCIMLALIIGLMALGVKMDKDIKKIMQETSRPK